MRNQNQIACTCLNVSNQEVPFQYHYLYFVKRIDNQPVVLVAVSLLNVK